MLNLIAEMRDSLDKMEALVMRMFNKPEDAPVAPEPVVDDGDSAAEPVPEDMAPAPDAPADGGDAADDSVKSDADC